MKKMFIVIFVILLSYMVYTAYSIPTGGGGNKNLYYFPGDVKVIGVLEGDSPLIMREGYTLVDINDVNMFKMYVKGHGTEGSSIPSAFENTIILETSTLINNTNMELAFWNKTDNVPTLVLNQGASGRATTFNRSLQIGKALAVGGFDEDFTLAEGFNYADFNTPGTGADLGVEDDIEAKGSIYAQENLQVDGDANIDGDLTVKGVSFPVDISCKVTKSAGQTIADNTEVILSWNQETYDTDSMHNNITNNTRITIKTAGKFHISCYGAWGISASGRRIIDFLKNGSSMSKTQYVPINKAQHTASYIGEFDVNDYIEVSVFQDSGGDLNFLANQRYFEVHKIN